MRSIVTWLSGAILAGMLVLPGGMLGTPTPARANGTADPVGLIASAAIIPFWAAGAQFTVFEVTSLNHNPNMHAFFFDAKCNRVFSLPFRMTEHDADITFSQDLGLDFNGLMVLAKSRDNITPEALEAPITLRGHRVDFDADAIGVIDPISGANAEDPKRTWNPLRSGASTITFPKSTVWWFVCPRNSITVDLGGGIPPLPPGADIIRMRVFDLEEKPILDTQVRCDCLTGIDPGELHPLFAAESRYVELVSYLGFLPVENPPSFVLYREIRVTGGGGFHAEDFARQPGMSAATLLSGEAQPHAR